MIVCISVGYRKCREEFLKMTLGVERTAVCLSLCFGEAEDESKNLHYII